MRVVSLVPSWTETLLHAGVNVVGRSHFCIHPREKVNTIPAVGGTKNWDFARIKELKPDLLLLDREENPKFMAEQDELPYLATHVEAVASVPSALTQMSVRLNNSHLATLAQRWEIIAQWQGLSRWTPGDPLPGLLEWGREPVEPVRRAIYVIWRNPWMTVAKTTFIGSVLEKCGLASYLEEFPTKYPVFDLNTFPPDETLLLFSSEPYPFLRKKEALNSLPNPYGFVDGEAFSWFGLRSLEFLEKLKNSTHR
jgi:iron complex transport system substrate-binding protein